MKVYVKNITRLLELSEESEEWNNLLQKVSEERYEKVNRYKYHDDRARSLAAGLLFRKGLEEYQGLPKEYQGFSEKYHGLQEEYQGFPGKYYGLQTNGFRQLHDPQIEISQSGKPFLINPSGICFNLSHSGKYVALIIGEKECGIDIQQKKSLKPGFAERFFHAEEIAYLRENQQADEMQIWTMKEAYVKCTGEGLSRGVNSFSVVPFLKEGYGRKDGKFLTGISNFSIPDYSLSVVYENEKKVDSDCEFLLL